jgi:hypothetical protein
MSGRRESIRRRQAAIDALRQERRSHEEGWRAIEPRGGVSVDVTAERVKFLDDTIAELERVNAIDERKDREERED